MKHSILRNHLLSRQISWKKEYQVVRSFDFYNDRQEVLLHKLECGDAFSYKGGTYVVVETHPDYKEAVCYNLHGNKRHVFSFDTMVVKDSYNLKVKI